MADKEIKEAKSLRWLANQFPKVENPKDNGDRLCNCINLYCTNAAELIERQAAEIKRLSTLAELGNTRANDYRVMRDRALKAEAENERLAKGWKADVILTANVKAEAYKECIEKVKEKSKKSEIVCSGALVTTSYLISAKNLNNLLKELVGE